MPESDLQFDADPDDSRSSRRTFLRGTGVAVGAGVALAATGGLIGGSPAGATDYDDMTGENDWGDLSLYKQDDGRVFVGGGFGSIGSTSYNTLVGTLPEGYAPDSDMTISCNCVTESGFQTGYFTVRSGSGDFEVYQMPEDTSGVRFDGQNWMTPS